MLKILEKGSAPDVYFDVEVDGESQTLPPWIKTLVTNEEKQILILPDSYEEVCIINIGYHDLNKIKPLTQMDETLLY